MRLLVLAVVLLVVAGLGVRLTAGPSAATIPALAPAHGSGGMQPPLPTQAPWAAGVVLAIGALFVVALLAGLLVRACMPESPQAAANVHNGAHGGAHEARH